MEEFRNIVVLLIVGATWVTIKKQRELVTLEAGIPSARRTIQKETG
jgi:hypothetical protein